MKILSQTVSLISSCSPNSDHDLVIFLTPLVFTYLYFRFHKDFIWRYQCARQPLGFTLTRAPFKRADIALRDSIRKNTFEVFAIRAAFAFRLLATTKALAIETERFERKPRSQAANKCFGERACEERP